MVLMQIDTMIWEGMFNVGGQDIISMKDIKSSSCEKKPCRYTINADVEEMHLKPLIIFRR